jgi:hypothetical protein
MKIDTYTKLVLSVIAVSLAIIALKDVPVISTAQASLGEDGKAVKVEIVSIRQPQGQELELMGGALPGYKWDALSANLEDFNRRLGALPVKFEER